MENKKYECYKKSELCEVGDEENGGCRYWVDWLDVGNCALRNTTEHTLKEVGMMLGISKERARQLEERGLAKMKVIIKAMRRERLKKSKRPASR